MSNFRRILSAGLSAVMITAVPLNVFAADPDPKEITGGTVSIDNNIDYSGSDTALKVSGDKTDVSVAGDVNAPSGGGIQAGDSAKVTVNGSVSAGGIGISAVGNGSDDGNDINITVKGNISGRGETINAADGAYIKIEGNAEGNGIGIKADGNSGSKPGSGSDASVDVDGDLIIITDDVNIESGGVWARNGADVTIGGDIVIRDDAGLRFKARAHKTAEAVWGSTITVEGSVDSDTDGVSAEGSDDTGASVVTINGDFKSGHDLTIGIYGKNGTVVVKKDLMGKNNGKDIVIRAESEGGEVAVGGTIQNDEQRLTLRIDTDDAGNINYLPEIVIGEISDPDNINVIRMDGMKLKEVSEETKREVLDNIKYIVNTNPDSMEGKGSFTITKLNGDALDRDGQNLYDVTRKSEQIVVRIAVSAGYEVGSFSAGKNNTYVRNADGSYTITVADGGGINIEAFIKAIEKDPDPGKPKAIGDGRSERDGSSVTAGSFVGTGRFVTFKKADGTTAKNEWITVSVNGTVRRCRVDENGFLKTGLYTENGDTFYLEDRDGADYGFMHTGWRLIDGKWYYFMPYDGIAGGTAVKTGAMLKGVTTPDGYKVGSDGTYTE